MSKLVARYLVFYDYHPTHGQFRVSKVLSNVKLSWSYTTKKQAKRRAYSLNLVLDHVISCATVEARKELQAELRGLLGIVDKVEE